jgi:ATP adenylyltransferase
MDHLWTPWRFQYISTGPQKKECVFCSILKDGVDHDQENLILKRARHNFVILNRFPYTSGHLLIVLYRHIADLTETSTEEKTEIIELASECESALREIYHPEGFNIGFNLGKCAGAGVECHLHMHLVPRWVGDSNMVSVLSQTRIIPEELETTYRKLLPILKNG